MRFLITGTAGFIGKLLLFGSAVERALAEFDELWCKLDAGTEAYFHAVDGTRLPFRRILVPTNGSYYSDAAFELAARYAENTGASIHVLYVSEGVPINPLLPDDHPDMVKVWWEPEEGAEYLTWLRNR